MVEIDIDKLLSHIVYHLPRNAEKDDPENGNKAWTLHLKRLLEDYGQP